MGFEEIIIGKIKSPNEFYFVPVDEDHKVYNRQVREMKEFVNLKEKPENCHLKYPEFIRRLVLSNVVECKDKDGNWKILASFIAESCNDECKTYAIFDHIDGRTYHGDLVIQMKSDSKKNTFLDEVLTKEPKPTGNFFSVKRIYLNEGLITAVNHDGFNTVDEEQEEVEMHSPENLTKSDSTQCENQKSSIDDNIPRHLIEKEKRKITRSAADETKSFSLSKHLTHSNALADPRNLPSEIDSNLEHKEADALDLTVEDREARYFKTTIEAIDAGEELKKNAQSENGNKETTSKRKRLLWKIKCRKESQTGILKCVYRSPCIRSRLNSSTFHIF